MKTYKGVLLDVDGTLVDSNDAHAEAWVEAFGGHGFQVAFRGVRERIGKGGDKLVMELVGLEEDHPKAQAVSQSRTEIFLKQRAPKLRAFPGSRDLVGRMKQQGLKVVVASSAKSDELGTLLAIAQVDDLIEARTSSDDAENSKPDPDIIVAALEEIGLHADEVVMLGDTPYDVQAATRACVDVIAVRSGGWADEDMAGAVAYYDDVADLLARYDESPLAASGRSDY